MEGSRFKQLLASQERLGAQRDELEKQRKSLSKRRPPSGGTAVGGRSSSPAQPAKSGFVKPQVARSVYTHTASPLRLGSGHPFSLSAHSLTPEEYQERDELLKLRQNALKKVCRGW